MTQRQTLSNKRIAITGAARGIGRATAAAAIARGARVALIDRDELAVKAAADELGPAALAFVGDVTEPEMLTAAIDAAARELGGLDVVFANAGVAPKVVTVAGTSLAEFDRVIGVNLRGVWNTVQAALPHLQASKGRLVLVASVYSFLNGAFCAPYAMSKAGVEALGRALRVELTAEQVDITTAHFGFVDTDLVRGSFDGDPLADRLEGMFPSLFTKRLTAEQAAGHLLRAVEDGKARIVAPAPWLPLDALRGILGPLGDGAMPRLPQMRALLTDARAREAAGKAGA